jgi:hypothetical protein
MLLNCHEVATDLDDVLGRLLDAQLDALGLGLKFYGAVGGDDAVVEWYEGRRVHAAVLLRMIGDVGAPNLLATDRMNEAVRSLRAPQTALQAAHFRSAQCLPVGWLMMATGYPQ